MPDPSASGAYALSALPPLGAFFGVEPATLLVGVEMAEDGLRAYLGARWKGVYLLVEDEEDRETFRRAWRTGQHVWLSPVPPPELLHQAPKPDSAVGDDRG